MRGQKEAEASRLARVSLPTHWRDVRDWSMEKRQSHGVRRPAQQEPQEPLLWLLYPPHSTATCTHCFLSVWFRAM